MSQTPLDKSCQTYSVDWNNIQSECPCCHSHIKIDFKCGPDSAQLSLTPSGKLSMDSIQSSGGTNSSLVNIVSVETCVERNFTPRDQIVSLSFNNLGCEDENSSGVNESTSSSVSNNSHSRGSHLEPIVQITSTPDLPPKMKSLEPLLPPSQSSSRPFPNQDIRLKCQFLGCGEVLDGPQQLELHYRGHKGEKIQKCNYYQCNRLFASREKLRNHVRCRHTNERPFKCDQCGKAFTSPKHLKDHGLLHSDERPFLCEWEGCGVRFRRRHHLVAHNRVHTKERPFSCHFPGCDMKFSKTHHVKRHYDTHFKNTAYKMYQAELSAIQVPSVQQLRSPPGAPTVSVPSSSSSYIFLP